MKNTKVTMPSATQFVRDPGAAPAGAGSMPCMETMGSDAREVDSETQGTARPIRLRSAIPASPDAAPGRQASEITPSLAVSATRAVAFLRQPTRASQLERRALVGRTGIRTLPSELAHPDVPEADRRAGSPCACSSIAARPYLWQAGLSMYGASPMTQVFRHEGCALAKSSNARSVTRMM